MMFAHRSEVKPLESNGARRGAGVVKVCPQTSEIQQQLLETGIIVRPCGGYELPEHLRVSIGTPEQNERLVRELERLLGAER